MARRFIQSLLGGSVIVRGDPMNTGPLNNRGPGWVGGDQGRMCFSLGVCPVLCGGGVVLINNGHKKWQIAAAWPFGRVWLKICGDAMPASGPGKTKGAP